MSSYHPSAAVERFAVFFAMAVDVTDDELAAAEARLAAVAAAVTRLRPTWMLAARCRRSTIDFTDLRFKAQALAECDRCPVQRECLDWAYEHDDRVAVMGGTTPAQRAAMAADRAS